MTDKVQKIREEVERLYNQSLADENRQADRGLERAANVSYGKSKACKEILSFIDSMQEEPVSIWHDASEKSNEPENVVIINPSDNTGEVVTRCVGVYQGRIWAYTSELLKFGNSCNIGKNLQEEPVSEGLEEAAFYYAESCKYEGGEKLLCVEHFKAGANWQKEKEYTCYEEAFEDGAKWKVENLWKSADGDDLPDIDREVIVLCNSGRVAFGHRPIEKFIAKPIGYGRTEEYEVKTYDKGGWNIPDIKWWLDCSLPNMEED